MYFNKLRLFVVVFVCISASLFLQGCSGGGIEGVNYEDVYEVYRINVENGDEALLREGILHGSLTTQSMLIFSSANEVFLTHEDGTGKQLLARFSENLNIAYSGIQSSANDESIAFTEYNNSSVGLELYVVKTNGSGVVYRSSTINRDELNPELSVDGNKVIFEEVLYGENRNARQIGKGLGLVDLNNNSYKQIASSSTIKFTYPIFNSSTTHIYYISFGSSDRPVLKTYNIEADSVEKTIDLEIDIIRVRPFLTSDEKLIYSNGLDDLYELNLSTGTIRTLFSGYVGDWYYNFSSDGSQVASFNQDTLRTNDFNGTRKAIFVNKNGSLFNPRISATENILYYGRMFQKEIQE